jgi:Contractile injection system tube protein
VPTLKGAFVKLDAGLLGFAPNIVIFQFNPETVSRTPAQPVPQMVPEGAGVHNTNQRVAQPGESISFSLRLDATDQLAAGDPEAAAFGVLPALSAVELLLYPDPPPSASLSTSGGQSYQNPPQKLPTVLFFWGVYRILPVNLTSLSIQETEYDQMLTPIRAEVSVTCAVQTSSMLGDSQQLEKGAYDYSRDAKEMLAALNALSPPDLLTKTIASV